MGIGGSINLEFPCLDSSERSTAGWAVCDCGHGSARTRPTKHWDWMPRKAELKWLTRVIGSAETRTRWCGDLLESLEWSDGRISRKGRLTSHIGNRRRSCGANSVGNLIWSLSRAACCGFQMMVGDVAVAASWMQRVCRMWAGALKVLGGVSRWSRMLRIIGLRVKTRQALH